MVADPASKKPSTVSFDEIVGQDDLKEVLLLAVVHDGLSGAVLSGEKGTAKSTAVRALVDLLGEQQVVADCPYGCDPTDPAGQCAACQDTPAEELTVETRSVPLVTLPLGATRDRVVGTLSIEDAMAGETAFDPGLLARAHRGILYVDEINLLDDHLVDVLLDAAASGVNTVERDGMSVSHPAEFTLIGTMNPEEGDLRPQLRDRFDLQATVTGCRDLEDRVEIIDRALSLDGDGRVASEDYTDETDELRTDEPNKLRTELQAARESVGSVSLPTEFKRTIAELCLDAEVDGHRADIATARAAMALAALDNRPKVLESDIRTAAKYTLPHRLQSQPFEDPPDPDALLDDHFDDNESDGESHKSDGESPESGDEDGDSDSTHDDHSTGDGDSIDEAAGDPTDGDSDDEDIDEDTADGDNDDESNTAEEPTDSDTESNDGGPSADSRSSDAEQPAGSGEQNGDTESPDSESETDATPLVPGQTRAPIGEAAAPDLADETNHVTDPTGQVGSHGQHQSAGSRGPRIRTEQATDTDPVDAVASVRAAAKQGHSRVEHEDRRTSIRQRGTAATIVFAVDASASMAPAMQAAKGVVLELLRDAYEQRDEVAFVAFGGEDAKVLLPPTRSVSLAARHLKSLPTGDRTPLPAGLDTARSVIEQTNSPLGIVVLVTDGRATVADGSPTEATRQAARRLKASGTPVVVVDAAPDQRNGLIPIIAEEADGRTIPLSALQADVIAATVAESE